MLKDITLGQYYPTESVIHRLDPRVKLVATLMYIVSLFLFHDFVGFIVVNPVFDSHYSDVTCTVFLYAERCAGNLAPGGHHCGV